MASPKKNKLAREGDVLGISNADLAVQIPAPPGRSHRPHEGIEVRGHASGIGDLRRGSGATGIDMGGGGTGTDVDQGHARRRPAQENEEE